MKKLYTLLFIAFTLISNAQIASWNFNAGSGSGATLVSDLGPTTGSGTLTLIGGTSEAYATGNDITVGTTDKALNLSAFPADGTASATAGLQVNVNTTNYSNITVSYDRKGSNTGSRWEEFQYTVDGTNWIVLGNNSGSTTNVATGMVWPTTTYTLPATANNNSNFACRMVSIFAPSTSAYQAIGTGSYGTAGTWRFDNLTVNGSTLAVNQNSIAGLSVYPNPVTNGVLYINSDANATRTVVVYDILGKQVVKTTTSNAAINVSALNAGVYMVKITEEGKTATRKLVIR